MRLLSLAFVLLAAGPALATHVPFVGCPSDGQTGPKPPPHATATPDLPAAAATQLAYYGSDDTAVLAPRGWHCFGTYGSNGVSLYVAPGPIGWGRIMAEAGIAGPAIQLSVSDGGTSGRFEVADIAGRILPAAKVFVDGVEAEKMSVAVPRYPYPADKITHRGPYEALYTTPAGQMGLGTRSHLRVDALPIDGIVRFEPEQDNVLLHLSARLPTAQRPLVAYIIADLHKRPLE